MDQDLPNGWGVFKNVVAVSQHLLLLTLSWFVHDLGPMAGDRLVFVVFFIAGDPVTSCAPLRIPVAKTFFHDFLIFNFFENCVLLKISVSNFPVGLFSAQRLGNGWQLATEDFFNVLSKLHVLELSTVLLSQGQVSDPRPDRAIHV